nr:HAD family phosphatase [Arthrobacter roseus]
MIIFDCDGVLVDSETLTTAVEAQLLTELGYPHTVQDVVDQYMGRSAAEVAGLLEAMMGAELADQFDADSTAQIHESFDSSLAVVPGIPALLDALDDNGVRTCVASSGSHAKMKRTLGLTGLRSRFEGRIYSATEVPRGKPAPDIFLHAAASEGVPAEQCVVIEDSVNGVRAARAAGMRVLGYGGGLSDRAALEAAGAEVFERMDHVWPLLSGVNELSRRTDQSLSSEESAVSVSTRPSLSSDCNTSAAPSS